MRFHLMSGAISLRTACNFIIRGSISLPTGRIFLFVKQYFIAHWAHNFINPGNLSLLTTGYFINIYMAISRAQFHCLK